MLDRSVLALLPEPVLLLRDGKLHYKNGPAQRLLLELPPAYEFALPEALTAFTLCSGPFLQPELTLGSRTYSVRGIPVSDGALLLILRPVKEELSPLLMGRLAENLRSPLNALFSRSSLLDGQHENAETIRL